MDGDGGCDGVITVILMSVQFVMINNNDEICSHLVN